MKVFASAKPILCVETLPSRFLRRIVRRFLCPSFRSARCHDPRSSAILARRLNSTSREDPVGSPSAGPVCKIAACPVERRAAFRLLYQAYLAAGLIEPNPYEMRVTPHHLSATTDVFLATDGERPGATVSLIRDGEQGLPCEVLFPKQVAGRRQIGARLAEASSLALMIAAGCMKRRSVLIGLMRLLAQAAHRQGIDELVAAVHPRHASFYRRVLGFEVFGAPIPHRQLRDHPAMGLSLRFPQIERWPSRRYEAFFGSLIPDALVEPRPITQREQVLLRPVAALADRFRLIVAD